MLGERLTGAGRDIDVQCNRFSSRLSSLCWTKAILVRSLPYLNQPNSLPHGSEVSRLDQDPPRERERETNRFPALSSSPATPAVVHASKTYSPYKPRLRNKPRTADAGAHQPGERKQERKSAQEPPPHTHTPEPTPQTPAPPPPQPSHTPPSGPKTSPPTPPNRTLRSSPSRHPPHRSSSLPAPVPRQPNRRLRPGSRCRRPPSRGTDGSFSAGKDGGGTGSGGGGRGLGGGGAGARRGGLGMLRGRGRGRGCDRRWWM